MVSIWYIFFVVYYINNVNFIFINRDINDDFLKSIYYNCRLKAPRRYHKYRFIQPNLINSGLDPRDGIRRDPYGSAAPSDNADEESPGSILETLSLDHPERIYISNVASTCRRIRRALSGGIRNWRWTVVGRERNDLKSRHADERWRERDGVRGEEWARELLYDGATLCQFSLERFQRHTGKPTTITCLVCAFRCSIRTLRSRSQCDL